MRLKNGLLENIMQRYDTNKIYLFGAGKRLKEMLQRYGNVLQFIAVADNGKEKQKIGYVEVADRKIPIISLEQLEECVDEKTCIIITMRKFSAVYYELENRKKFDVVDCYIYDLVLSEEKDKRLYPKEYHLPQNAFVQGMQRIPKAIHYCWFGGKPIPEKFQRYMESWKKYCPDYDIVRWDESNYDVAKNAYMKAAYEEKKWAFVSDYARVDIINTYGGIYLDTDVELLKSLDPFLTEKGFCGFENENYVAFGLGFGTEKENPILQELLELYQHLAWDGGKTVCPVLQTNILRVYGLKQDNSWQRLDDMTIYPTTVLCGKSLATHQLQISRDTYAIHHYAGTWLKAPDEDTRLLYLLREAAIYE